MVIKIYDKKPADVVLVPLVQDEGLSSLLASIADRVHCNASLLQNDFKADAKEILPLYFPEKTDQKLYLIGLGKKSGFSDVQSAFRSFCHKFKSKLPAKIAVDLKHLAEEQVGVFAEAAVSGLMLGRYNFGKFKPLAKDKPAPTGFESEKAAIGILVATGSVETASIAARRAQAFAETQLDIFDLVNAPGNMKTPLMLADFAQKAGDAYGFSVKTLLRGELEAEGLHALLAVNQGSPHTPALILLEYSPKGSKKHSTSDIGLVGKGVTFDTGGISIKPSANMQYMKSDMGGAAAVLGAFMVAAKLQLPIHLTGAIPSTENMVDGLAAKPGDVFPTYSGKTIEITDTDAEGRVILADGLAYLIKNYKPETIIDLATLTGSIIRAIGTQAAGLFTQNDQLANLLLQSGDAVGERLWRMPMWEEYGSDLKSDVADLRNYTGKPMAESISAAKFLEHFTDNHPAWAHLDIAGTAFGDSEFAQTKSATAFGVRLLVSFIENWIKK